MKRVEDSLCGFLAALLAISMLAGCQSAPGNNSTQKLIDQEMQRATQREPVAVPPAVSQALLMPQGIDADKAAAKPAERRFNLAVNNAPAAQVFAALAADSRYSIVVHPEVAGNITVNLKDVTLMEALSSIRDVYGYDYNINGDRITVQPLTLQSRIFQINYLNSARSGRSDTHVISGSILTGGVSQSSGSTTGGVGPSSNSTDGAMVETTTKSDFWSELGDSIKAIVGTGEGRSVVLSPQSGVIIVRALPKELHDVESFIRLSQINVERQVMLEAKIVEVDLNDGYQNGINWVALAGNTARLGAGVDPKQLTVPSGSLGQAGAIAQVLDQNGNLGPNTLGNVVTTPIVGSITGLIPNSPLSNTLGLAFTTNNFNAILSFLETQGATHVISSPRIATINNQKAVLKVGSDDYFVTNITTTTTTGTGGSTTSPTINLQAFFSGISLDVTPQIDDLDNVMLHIRPSVSVVTERNKQINLGTAGVFNLPLASSRSNETDSIVRVREGNIVAIGGLMEQAQSSDTAKVPGVGDIPVAGELFSQGQRALQKRELVVLLKATIIRGDQQWAQDVADTAGRLSGATNESVGPTISLRPSANR
ncbi:MAG TPA: secretin N-terminal domain-containing protein [Rhodocyclaceae bacterium]|nr:secretin N-terminal domain-containing protein [Rhodocyclaceae bacterium]